CGATVAAAGAVGGRRSPLLCAARARLLHLWFPTRLHHRPYAGLPHRSRSFCASRRLDHRGDRAVQHHRLARLGLAGKSPAQALHPLVHLFRPCRRGAGVHPIPDNGGIVHPLLRGHGPALCLPRLAPPNGIIALSFAPRWPATLAGLAFFSHQVGGFLGVWLGGVVFVRTGSYDAVWWLSILFGVLSAVINLPIVEKPVVRTAAVPA